MFKLGLSGHFSKDEMFFIAQKGYKLDLYFPAKDSNGNASRPPPSAAHTFVDFFLVLTLFREIQISMLEKCLSHSLDLKW